MAKKKARKRYSEKQKREITLKWESDRRSEIDLTLAKFAKAEGVPVTTLKQWCDDLGIPTTQVRHVVTKSKAKKIAKAKAKRKAKRGRPKGSKTKKRGRGRPKGSTTKRKRGRPRKGDDFVRMMLDDGTQIQVHADDLGKVLKRL